MKTRYNFILVIVLAIMTWLSVGCAAPKKFSAVSTTGVHQSIAETRTEIQAFRASNESAKGKAGRVKSELVEIREVVKDNPNLVLRVNRAESELDSLTQDLIRSDQLAQNADARAQVAETRLVEVDKKNEELFRQVNKVAAERDKYKKFWDTGHKYFGFGAIALGLGILFRNILIAILALVVLAGIFFALSFVFPALGPLVSLGLKPIKALIAKFRK